MGGARLNTTVHFRHFQSAGLQISPPLPGARQIPAEHSHWGPAIPAVTKCPRAAAPPQDAVSKLIGRQRAHEARTQRHPATRQPPLRPHSVEHAREVAQSSQSRHFQLVPCVPLGGGRGHLHPRINSRASCVGTVGRPRRVQGHNPPTPPLPIRDHPQAIRQRN